MFCVCVCICVCVSMCVVCVFTCMFGAVGIVMINRCGCVYAQIYHIKDRLKCPHLGRINTTNTEGGILFCYIYVKSFIRSLLLVNIYVGELFVVLSSLNKQRIQSVQFCIWV